MADEAQALTTDAAIEALNDQDLPEADAAPEDENEDQADLPAADAPESEADGDVDEGDEPDDGDEGEEAHDAGPAIDPPHSWDAEAKAKFAQLPRDLQEYYLGREQQRDGALSQAQQDAAEARKTASIVSQFAEMLDQLVPQAQTVFGDRWDTVDWTALADADPGEYWRLRALRDEEAGELQRLTAAQQAAKHQSEQQFLVNRNRELAATLPELYDPKEGEQRQVELSTFITGEGIPPELVRLAPAGAWRIAWKALQYDRAQASARRTVAPQPKPAMQARTVRPAGAPEAGSIRQQRAAKASQRLRESGSVDDAVAFLNAQG